jgi:catechol 2,3-dioxygenase-like lactoylglutathione lyase family enzyme
MAERPLATLSATVLGAPDPRSLAEFYHRLLGWEIVTEQPGWVVLRPPGGGTGLSFQEEADHVPPVWPPRPGEQQMMMHLDLRVDDLEAAGTHVEAAGARLAEFQPQEGVRVYLDPAGHPFCLFLPGH